MPDAPQSCPTCGIEVPEGAVRCPGCGRVFGEENRCPHCHAIAAVIERRGKTVCAACGKPRVGSVTLGGDTPRGATIPVSAAGQRAGTTAMLARARGRAQRGFGIASLTAGIVAAAIVAALLPGGAGIAMALLMGVVGVGVGAFAIRAGARNMESARKLDREAHHAEVMKLAAASGGVLTAAALAEKLRLPEEEADAILTSLVGDGSRVDVEVDDEGVVEYVFHALRKRPRVRVEVEDASEALEEEAEVLARRMEAKQAESGTDE
ncbi:MAG: zinc ribbon domain-containing protein [Sandaracinaceae bacterium]